MTLPNDELAGLANVEIQKEAAGLAQDGFTRIFRLLAEGDEAAAELGLSLIEARARDWAGKGENEDDENPAPRPAYQRARSMGAWPGRRPSASTALPGSHRPARQSAQPARRASHGPLRTAVRRHRGTRRQCDRFQGRAAPWRSSGVVARNGCKRRSGTVRRTPDAASGQHDVGTLTETMPNYGWRLLADALAHIQLRCLDPKFRRRSRRQGRWARK